VKSRAQSAPGVAGDSRGNKQRQKASVGRYGIFGGVSQNSGRKGVVQMKNNKFFISGMLVVLLAFAFVLTGCPTGTSGGDDDLYTPPPAENGISTPAVINGYYGVTDDGKTIQIVITPSGSKNAGRAIVWSAGDTYTAYVNGKVVSQGTVVASAGVIAFASSDGSTVNITGKTIVIKTGNGTTYNGNITPAADYYYCIGTTTTYKESEINTLFSGKTPEQVYNYCSTTGVYHFDYPRTETGTWEEMKKIAKEEECPDTIVSAIAKKLDSNVSAWDYYYADKYNSNVMFYIARLPLTSTP
jgi:hypothetical protein